jgi:hypothetical protein
MSFGWTNFYYLVGSASASLIGLMFVVITLVAGRQSPSAHRGIGLYSTPTLVNFASVFAISAVTLVPRITVHEAGVVYGCLAAIGLACALRSAWGILRAPPGYEPPHWSDWWLYGFAPLAFYLALVLTSIGVWLEQPWSARAMAGLLLALVLLGIRNAWDTITWIAPRRDGRE